MRYTAKKVLVDGKIRKIPVGEIELAPLKTDPIAQYNINISSKLDRNKKKKTAQEHDNVQ